MHTKRLFCDLHFFLRFAKIIEYLSQMYPKLLLYFLLVCLSLSCERTESPAEIKTKFLAKTSLQTPNEVLQKQMDSLKVSLLDIYHYCQKSQEVAYKSKFITCIYGKVDNYLQEEKPEYEQGILYDLNKFNNVLRNFKEAKHTSFLDVGSGNGEKVYAALCWGFTKSVGLEYSKKLVQISQHALQDFIQQKKIDIIHTDALKISAEIYQDIDIIYLFSPIKENKIMAQLTEKILKNMKEGAVLLEMRFAYHKELEKIMGLPFPSLADIAIKKENNQFYYTAAQNSAKNWTLLEKK